MGDIVQTMQDFEFISQVESAIVNDIRKADTVGDVLWHEQATDHHVFRIVLDPLLSDRDVIIEALTNSGSEALQLGATKPYEKDGELLVWVKRPTPGAVYPPDEPDTYATEE